MSKIPVLASAEMIYCCPLGSQDSNIVMVRLINTSLFYTVQTLVPILFRQITPIAI
jgi:hypothetical protein